jgi:hypothetical protein
VLRKILQAERTGVGRGKCTVGTAN